MAIVKTQFIVTSLDTSYEIPGDWTPEAIVSSYSSQVPGIGSMTNTSTVETRSEGQVRVITFSPRTGTKG